MVPLFPEEPLLETVVPCPDGAVCLTEKSVVALALWIRDAVAYYEAVTACPGVVEQP